MASYPQLITRENFRYLRESWLEYVEMELKKEGIAWEHRHCNCGKSRTSYPHWPPTCKLAAVDQLRCLVGESAPHRQYLAHCWMTFLLGKNTADSEDDKNLISLVHQSCPGLLTPKHETHRHRRGKLDCERVCQPVLDINSIVLALFIGKSARCIDWHNNER